MSSRAFRGLWAVCLNIPLVFSPIVQAQQGDQLALPAPDPIAPVVVHEPAAEGTAAGEPLAISATVTDNVGVSTVTLFYRAVGEESYKRVQMRRIGTTDMYMATVAADEVREPGVEYYIQASDTAGNSLLHGYSFSPLRVGVAAAMAPVAAAPSATGAQAKKEGGVNWLWIVLGVGAVAALAASGGGGGGNGDKTGDVVIGGPLPQ